MTLLFCGLPLSMIKHFSILTDSTGGPLIFMNIKLDTRSIDNEFLNFVLIRFISLNPLVYPLEGKRFFLKMALNYCLLAFRFSTIKILTQQYLVPYKAVLLVYEPLSPYRTHFCSSSGNVLGFNTSQSFATSTASSKCLAKLLTMTLKFTFLPL